MTSRYTLPTKSEIWFSELIEFGYPLFTQQQIKLAVLRLARQLSEDLTSPIECVILMNGAYQLASDLSKVLSNKAVFNFMRISRYQHDTPGELDFRQLQQLKLISSAKEVLIIDDVYDEGITLTRVLNTLQHNYPDRVFKTLVLIKKERQQTYNPDYIGFTINPELYLFGYGMDLDNQWRHLPEVWVKT